MGLIYLQYNSSLMFAVQTNSVTEYILNNNNLFENRSQIYLQQIWARREIKQKSDSKISCNQDSNFHSTNSKWS